jgi:adenine-specific DNA methylase
MGIFWEELGLAAQMALAEVRLQSPSGRRFIESIRFPWREVSEASAVEKGPGRPPHWEMVFWWTRKPLISARAIIAGCLLPEDTSPRAFLRAIGVGGKSKAAHNNPPRKEFEESHKPQPKKQLITENKRVEGSQTAPQS